MITMFKTDTCIACSRMQPITDKYDVNVVNLSEPENYDYIDKYSLRAVPTFIRFDAEGNEVERHVGLINEKKFNELVEKG